MLYTSLAHLMVSFIESSSSSPQRKCKKEEEEEEEEELSIYLVYEKSRNAARDLERITFPYCETNLIDRNELLMSKLK